VFADAILPNAQEKLFRTYDASKSEVMFYTNIYTLVAQTCSALLSGDLVGMVHFVMGRPVLEYNYFSRFLEGGSNNTTTITDELMADDEKGDDMIMNDSLGGGEIKYTLICYMMIYILISHVAVSAHTSVVKKFGGVAAVFIGTARKGMTLILSFALFPKESNWRYPLGAILVLGGLTVASLDQQRNKHNNKSKLRGGSSNNETIPILPLDTDANNESHDNNFDPRMSESRPLVNMDVELGRLSAGSTGNGPERRR
jgi:adenosine 3'-phospho 5'-phosphosulfate transporter B3